MVLGGHNLTIAGVKGCSMWGTGEKMNVMQEKRKISRTTVVLTKRARQVLIRYRNSFGQKNVLSVGIELFDRLDPAEQIRLTSASEAVDQAQTPDQARDLWESIGALISDVPETAYQVLSAQQQAEVRRFKEMVSPAAAKTREAAGVLRAAEAEAAGRRQKLGR